MSKAICLDVDGVVSDLVGGINRELDKRGLLDFDYAHWVVGVFEDELTREIFGDAAFWMNLKPFVDSWYQVNEWWADGYDIFLVTARYSEVAKRMLLPWLDAWRVQYSQVFFKDMGSKLEIVSELDPVFMVEDNPYEVRALRDGGVDCYLMRAWYNSQFWEDFPSIGCLSEVVL